MPKMKENEVAVGSVGDSTEPMTERGTSATKRIRNTSKKRYLRESSDEEIEDHFDLVELSEFESGSQ